MDMLTEIMGLVDKFETVFKTFKLDIVLSAIINLIIIAVLFKLTNLFMQKLKERAAKQDSSALSNQLIPILDKIIKFLILFFVIASFLQTNGYSITSLIAGFGITGVAIGFAAQQTVADFFGTLAIIADKMYKIGDYISIAGVEGTVEDVNMLSTKIRTLDDFLVTVPNNNISGATIVNMSKAKKRRINEVFGVTYDTSNEKLQEAMQIIKDVCNEHNNVTKDTNVFIETLSASSIDIRLQTYVKTGAFANLAKVRSEVILEVVKRFRDAEIDFAFPSQSIYIEKK
ncbi:MAG: mechanosensitive ion channel family protein [Cyanobacteria bacterium SIG32]|nr:mechanosensitive ion channel family protein [Cyanobacteria bacterium SIG32]